MRFSLLGGAAFAVAAAAAMWSCGGSSSSGNPTSPGAVTSSATVNIMGQLGAQSFSPNPASVNQGDMVIWHNSGVRSRFVQDDESGAACAAM